MRRSNDRAGHLLHLLTAGFGTNATNRHVHSNDRFGGQSGLDMLTSNLSGFDPTRTWPPKGVYCAGTPNWGMGRAGNSSRLFRAIQVHP